MVYQERKGFLDQLFGAMWETMGKKVAILIAIIAIVVFIILFLYAIIAAIIGGIIGFLFCWLNKKYGFIKIADQWIFIVAIALIIIFIAIGNLVFPPANYIAAGLIGFVIGYWMRKKSEEEN